MFAAGRHELDRLLEDLNAYDPFDLLVDVAALQLAPENAARLQRLYALAGMAATLPRSTAAPSISMGRLRRVLNGPPLTESHFALAEDPFNNPLTESVTFYGGSYVTLPDYEGDAAFVFRRLMEAVLLVEEPFSAPALVDEVRALCAAVLALGDEVARRAGFGRIVALPGEEPRGPFLFSFAAERLEALNRDLQELGFAPVEGLPAHVLERVRELTAPTGNAVVPSSEHLGVLKGAVSFSHEELTAILNKAGASLESLSPLVVEQGAADFSSLHYDRNPLLVRPLVREGGRYVVAVPRALLSAACNALIGKAAERGVGDELAERFHRVVASNVRRSLSLMNCDPLPVRVSEPDDRCSTKAVSFCDVDKAISILLVTDDLKGYDPSRAYSAGWVGEEVSARLRQRLDEVERAIADAPDAPREVLRLVVLQGVEPVKSLLGVRVPETARRRHLVLDASDLEAVAMLEGGDPLALWKYARERRRFRERTPVLRISSELDEFYAYRRDYGYDFLSEGLPEGGRFAVVIPMGGAGALRREAQCQRDLHGAVSAGSGAVVEVASLHEDHTVPVYAPWRGGEPGEGVEVLVEALPVDVWILSHEHPLDARLRNLCFGFAEMVAYWLWQLTPGLERLFGEVAKHRRQLRVRVDVASEPGWFDETSGGLRPEDAVRCEATEAGDLLLSLRPSVKWMLGGPDNAGEREILREVLRGLRSAIRDFVGRDLGPDDARAGELLDRHAPLGRKKKLLFMSGEHNLMLVDLGLPPHRKVQQADLNELRDELGGHLAASEPDLPPGPVPDDRRLDLLKKVVGFFYGELESTASELSPEGVLEVLVAYNERIVNEYAQRALSIPTWIECFGSEAEMVVRLREEMPELMSASMASRLLIEYFSARPPQGERPIGLADYDWLLATASEVVEWGLVRDAVRYETQDLKLVVFGSGRLEVQGGPHAAGLDRFMGAHLAGEIGRSQEGFGRHWREEPEEADGPGYAESMDRATEVEFGTSLSRLVRFLMEAVRLGSDRDEEPKALALEVFLREMTDRLEWERFAVERAFDFFACRARDDFFSPPDPYRSEDVYPWRFNRPLSYLRRPLLVRASRSGEEEVVWGVKGCYRAATYLTELCVEGRLKAKTKPMKQLMGDLIDRRAEDFNHAVANVCRSDGALLVETQVEKLVGKRIERRRGQPLGDIDVLVADPRKKVLLAVETKDLAFARNPAELANELKNTFQTRGSKAAAVDIHLERVGWLKANLGLVLEHLGLPTREARRWRVEPLIVVNHELQSPYVVDCPVPVLSYRELLARG